jgi:hypothetical protein
MASISPAERLRRELESTLDGVGEEVDPVEAVGRVGARLILQHALEDEVTEYLARAPNGYEPVTVKTTSGSMQLERPRLRNVSQLDFASRVVGKGVARTHALEALVVASFLRGLSVREVEAALKEAFDEPVVSKSTVSRICQETAERYRAWCSRRLCVLERFATARHRARRNRWVPRPLLMNSWVMRVGAGSKPRVDRRARFSRRSRDERPAWFRWAAKPQEGPVAVRARGVSTAGKAPSRARDAPAAVISRPF